MLEQAREKGERKEDITRTWSGRVRPLPRLFAAKTSEFSVDTPYSFELSMGEAGDFLARMYTGGRNQPLLEWWIYDSTPNGVWGAAPRKFWIFLFRNP